MVGGVAGVRVTRTGRVGPQGLDVVRDVGERLGVCAGVGVPGGGGVWEGLRGRERDVVEARGERVGSRAAALGAEDTVGSEATG